MENKIIRVVGQNHSTFVSKLADMNKRLARRNLPVINVKLIEQYDARVREMQPVPYEPFCD